MTLVEALREALSAVDDADKLRQLLDVWQEVRAPEIAGMIDALTEVLPSQDLALAGKKPERIQRWAQACMRDDPLDLPTLLQAFPIGTIEEGQHQAELLSARTPDPRLARGLLAKLADPPYRSEAGIDFWRRVLEIVTAVADPRSRVDLRKAAAVARDSFRSPMNKWLRHWIREAGKKIPNTGPLSDDARSFLSDWHAQWSKSRDRSPAELLRAVYQDPADDGVRLVYADVLTERGDPRGEFITLQYQHEGGSISAVGRKREKQLFATHWKEWIGDLAPVVMKTGLEFERGFPAVVWLRWRKEAALRRLVGNEAWSTVREISTGGFRGFSNALGAVIMHPVMKALQNLEVPVSRELLVELCGGERLRGLRSLVYGNLYVHPGSWEISRGERMPEQGPRFDDDEMKALTDAPALPELTRLRIWGSLEHLGLEHLGWFIGGALMARLTSLEIGLGLRTIPDWIETVEARGLPLERLVLRSGTLMRTPAGQLRHLMLSLPSTHDSGGVPELVRVLSGFPTDTLHGLEVEWHRGQAPRKVVESLEAAVARQTELKVLELPD